MRIHEFFSCANIVLYCTLSFTLLQFAELVTSSIHGSNAGSLDDYGDEWWKEFTLHANAIEYVGDELRILLSTNIHWMISMVFLN